MQVLPTAFNTAIQQATVRPSIKVYAEFNHNRLADIANVNNPVDPVSEAELYPLESIIRAHRPGDGIPWAVVGNARAVRSDTINTRFRAPGADQQYKYWRSPFPAGPGGVLTGCAPEVNYSQPLNTNMLRVQFETYDGMQQPANVQLYYKTALLGAWQSAGTFTVPFNGRVDIYLQDNDTWSKTVNYANRKTIWGVRAVVTQMQQEGDYCNVVELAALYAKEFGGDEITDLQISTSSEDVSLMNPIGVIASSTMTVSFDNSDDRFNNDWINAEFRSMIQEDVFFAPYIGVFWNGAWYWSKQGEFYVDSWERNEADAIVTAVCTDMSKYLQRTYVEHCLFKDMSAADILHELFEIHGFDNSTADISSRDTDYKIPYVWFNNDETLWDAIKSVIQADHGTAWIDHLGRLRYESKRKLYDKTPVHEFSTDIDMPNLFGISPMFEAVFNRAKVYYEVFKPNVAVDGSTVVNSELWTPSDDIVLMSSPLDKPILDRNTLDVWIKPEEMETWPFAGKFNIEGEIYEYDGKWASPTGSETDKVVKRAADEYPTYKYTGQFNVTARGIDSLPNVHRIDFEGWGDTGFTHAGSHTYHRSKGIEDGRLYIRTTPAMRYGNYYATTRGIASDAYQVYGTKLRFPLSAQGNRENIAGMLIHRQHGTSPNGYYIELLTNDYKASRNDQIGNIRCYKVTGGAAVGLPIAGAGNPFVRPGTELNGVRGYDKDITYGRDYQLEVVRAEYEGNQHFSVYVDGQYVTGFTDNTYTSGLWGMFTRGHTSVEFEYFYCWSAPEGRDVVGYNPDPGYFETLMTAYQLRNRITGDYISGFLPREKSAPDSHTKWFFDEFGPMVHERRDFDILYNISPSFGNFIFNSNEWESALAKAYYTPFGAKFSIDNASRRIAVLHGTDPNAIEGEEVTYQLAVLGQALVRQEEQFVLKESRHSIRKHGVQELEVRSPWIQTEERAADIGHFIVDRWGDTTDTITADVFPHPGLQPTDLVLVHYPERHLYNREYHIVAIEYSWDNGLQCTLTLRRNRINPWV